MVPAFNETELPAHKGLLLPATGAAGKGLITAVADEAALVQPFNFTVTLYIPAFTKPVVLITGFCADEVKLFGPVQVYTPPGVDEALKFKAVPSQTGELVDAVGAAGIAFTTTEVLAAALLHCPTVTTTEYDPALAAVALLITGFCNDDVKPPGPVQL